MEDSRGMSSPMLPTSSSPSFFHLLHLVHLPHGLLQQPLYIVAATYTIILRAQYQVFARCTRYIQFCTIIPSAWTSTTATKHRFFVTENSAYASPVSLLNDKLSSSSALSWPRAGGMQPACDRSETTAGGQWVSLKSTIVPGRCSSGHVTPGCESGKPWESWRKIRTEYNGLPVLLKDRPEEVCLARLT